MSKSYFYILAGQFFLFSFGKNLQPIQSNSLTPPQKEEFYYNFNINTSKCGNINFGRVVLFNYYEQDFALIAKHLLLGPPISEKTDCIRKIPYRERKNVFSDWYLLNVNDSNQKIKVEYDDNFDKRTDLLLLKVTEKNLNKKTFKYNLRYEQPLIGEEIYLIDSKLVKNKLIYVKIPLTVISNKYDNEFTAKLDSNESVNVDKNIGSPVIDKEGKLIGILSSGIDNILFFSNFKLLKNYMTKYLPFKAPEPKED